MNNGIGKRVRTTEQVEWETRLEGIQKMLRHNCDDYLLVVGSRSANMLQFYTHGDVDGVVSTLVRKSPDFAVALAQALVVALHPDAGEGEEDEEP